MPGAVLPSIHELAASVARGTSSLARARARIDKTKPADLVAWIRENHDAIQRMLGTTATGPALRLAALEIGYAAALRGNSAYYVLNYGLNLGQILVYETGDTARGLQTLEMALQQTQAIELNTTDLVTSILVVAEAYYARHEQMGPEYFTAAQRGFEGAITLAQSGTCAPKVRAQAHVGLGECLCTLFGGVQPDYRASSSHFEQALELMASDAKDDLYVRAQHGLGRCFAYVPDANDSGYLRSVECLQAALQCAEQLGRHDQFRAICHELADIEARTGHAMRAVALYERALEITHPVRDRQAFGTLQGQLATLCSRAHSWNRSPQNNLKSVARACYVVACEAFDPDADTDAWASVMAGLARIRQTDGNLEEAIALVEDVLSRLHAPEHARRRSFVAADYVQMLVLLGRNQLALGAREEAWGAHEKARQARLLIADVHLAPHHLLVVDGHLSDFDAMLATPDDRGAIDDATFQVFQRALAVCPPTAPESEVRHIEDYLRVLCLSSGRYDELIPLARGRLARDATAVGARSTLAEYSDRTVDQKPYRDALVLAALRKGNIEAAEWEAEQARGRLLHQIAAAVSQKNDGARAEQAYVPAEFKARHGTLVREWMANRDENDIKQGLRRDSIAPWLEQTFREAKQWRSNWVVTAAEEVEASVSSIAITDPATAAIQFWSSDHDAGAFVRTAGDAAPRFIRLPELGPEQQWQWSREWFGHYSEFERRGAAALKSWTAVIDRVMSELSGICRPLFAYLDALSLRRLIITQDLLLDNIPLHAMTIDPAGTLLCDRYQVSFVPSLRLLNRVVARRAESVNRLLFVGDPQRDCANGSCGLTCGLSLPGPDDELVAIRGAWPDVHALVGRDCTPDAFLDSIERVRPDIIHLSVHGMTYFDDPLGSGVVLAYDGIPSEDPLTIYVGHRLQPVWGTDTAGEILTLDALIRKIDLRCCKLAVLNSCEPGLSSPIAQGQGLSVGNGFLAAGVSTVIAPLWRLDDFSAGLLARRFYAELARNPRLTLQALSRAQTWLRMLPMSEAAQLAEPRQLKAGISLSGDEYPFSHVFFWGAYQLHGDPGPVALEGAA